MPWHVGVRPACFFCVEQGYVVDFPKYREHPGSGGQLLGYLLIHTPMRLDVSEEGTDHRIDSSRETDADIDTDNHERLVLGYRY